MNDFADRENPALTGSAGAAEIERVARALGERFSVLRLLRADSFAEVYLARDTAHGGLVEIRTLAAGAGRDFRQRELFYLEAYAASLLSHMNIAGAGRPEEMNAIHFYATEHREGAETLRDLLARNGWLDAHAAAAIADQVASALDAAHQAGVLHLGLQPESILVEPDGWAVVSDFGIESSTDLAWARSERACRTGASYLSPEQAAGGDADHRSDLYSLGAVLYEMLTDRVPFDSDDDGYIRDRQAHYMPAPPHLIFMEVPKQVSDVVMRLLDKDPAGRFGSAAALQAALDRALSQSAGGAARVDAGTGGR